MPREKLWHSGNYRLPHVAIRGTMSQARKLAHLVEPQYKVLVAPRLKKGKYGKFVPAKSAKIKGRERVKFAVKRS